MGGAGWGVGVAMTYCMGVGVWTAVGVEMAGSPADVGSAVSATSPSPPGAPQAIATISKIRTTTATSNLFIGYYLFSSVSCLQESKTIRRPDTVRAFALPAGIAKFALCLAVFVVEFSGCGLAALPGDFVNVRTAAAARPP